MSLPSSAAKSACQHFAPAEAVRCVIILWACVPAIQPLLNHGLQDGSFDAAIHLYRLLDLDQTFVANPRLYSVAKLRSVVYTAARW